MEKLKSKNDQWTNSNILNTKYDSTESPKYFIIPYLFVL